MWLRWCALSMVVGLALVVLGFGVAINGHASLVECCGAGDQDRLAIELSLLGVIVSSLSTAGVAGALMRTARPHVRHPRPAGAGAGPTARSAGPPPGQPPRETQGPAAPLVASGRQ